MKNFIVLIDGPKGAGKSTLSELLKEKLANTEFFSIDEERKLIEKSGDKNADNKKAFTSIIEKIDKSLKQKRALF